MKKILLLVTVLVFTSFISEAQRNNRNDRKNDQYNNGYGNRRRAPSLSMGVQVIEPRGEFGKQYDRYPAGVSGLFTVNWGLSPIEFGFGAAWYRMGNINEDVIIIDGEDFNGNTLFTDGNLAVKGNMYSYQTLARFKPLAGPVQPYVDGIVGFRTFSSKTIIKEDFDGSSEVISEVREQRDFSILHGWAAGLKIRLNDYMMIEGRMEFMKGSEVSYIDPESIEISHFGNIQYQEITTRSDMRIFHLGISVEF